MSADGFSDAPRRTTPETDLGHSELAAQVRILRRWVIGLVALVTFLAGGVVGGAAIWWYQARQPGATLGLARAIQVYGDPAGRRAYRAALQEGRRASPQLVRDVQAARAAFAEILAQPAATPDAVQAGLGRLRQAEVALRTGLEPRVARALADVPADRRRAIADAILPPARRSKAAEP
ncbi:periplasmic heavy metal sensor [uncultured Alsobacter sp.]|uniref:periplasmic heavy metal sensor n=1 Tax=uncultured Alsobacter sp. TaxID=1748258 RepID=UPI0025DB124B|nr:periplasmic heavy metal sensor [uncultured Alsobacter sp.]